MKWTFIFLSLLALVFVGGCIGSEMSSDSSGIISNQTAETKPFVPLGCDQLYPEANRFEGYLNPNSEDYSCVDGCRDICDLSRVIVHVYEEDNRKTIRIDWIDKMMGEVAGDGSFQITPVNEASSGIVGADQITIDLGLNMTCQDSSFHDCMNVEKNRWVDCQEATFKPIQCK